MQKAVALATLLAAFAACAPAPVQPVRQEASHGLHQALAAGGEVRGTALPPESAWSSPPRLAGAAIASDGWRLPDGPLPKATAEGLRQYVERGGRLLLLGYAAGLAFELGLEERPPEHLQPVRWGLDGRALQGRAALGFRLVSGRAEDLTAGLTTLDDQQHLFLLNCGEGRSRQGCWWDTQRPVRGAVLGRLAEVRDGRLHEQDAAVMLRWSLGAGEVLACGVVPDPTAADPAVAQNAQALLLAARHWLGGEGRGPVALWWRETAAEPAPPVALPPLGRRELPAMPLLAHWGWQVAVSDLRGGDTASPEQIVQDVLLPSFRSGADLLDLQLPDRARGYPLAWSLGDPLRRPDRYRGDAFWPQWSPSAIAGLCREAHARSMLVQAFLWPAPAAGGSLAEGLATVRFLGRELFDRRRLGQGALDGFGLHGHPGDGRGLLLAMVQDYLPAAHAYVTGAQPVPMGGALRVLDASDGRVAGLCGSGLSERFRPGFPGDLYPAGRLDCRVRQADPVRWEGATGGGSYADWLVLQANDFVRARIGQGAALWWQCHDPQLLGPDNEAYVHGIGLDPVRAAVAGRHLAAGQGGWRDIQRGFVEGAQTGFGAELPQPSQGPFLQNNWIKLSGSGGALQFDPQGLARFRRDEAVLLSPEFLRTRLTGGRPVGDEMRLERVDLLAAGARPEGGYQRVAVVGLRAEGDRRPPAVLGRAQAPRWPERAVFDLHLSGGIYELDLGLRAIQGRCVVELSLDGEVLQVIGCADDRPAQRLRVGLHLARPGGRTLGLEIVDGQAVALDVLRLDRVQDCAAETAVGVPAGHFASLRETAASSYHAEAAEIRTLADLPGFLWRAECQRVVRNLRMERSVKLPRHRRLGALADGDSERSLRGPFVLQGDGVPDLAVVPLQLGRYDHFALRDGELVFSALPEGSAVTSVGFLLLTEGSTDLAAVRRVFAALESPTELDLSAGEATLTSDLPIAWTRLLKVQQGWRTPYLVREQGWWLWRGAQPARDGGDWLRVCHLPGDAVQVLCGPQVLDGTRPGPGSVRLLALKDREPGAVTVRVLQQSPLVPQPSVVMGQDFDAVTVDGRPWQAFDGRTVLLPATPGTYRVVTTRHAGEREPRLLQASAPIERCSYDPGSRELTFLCRGRADRPAELAQSAIVVGGEVAWVEGGEIVEDAHLRFRDREQAAAARAGGTLLRFWPGVVKVRFGPPAAAPGGGR